jgi:hypothetical protein
MRAENYSWGPASTSMVAADGAVSTGGWDVGSTGVADAETLSVEKMEQITQSHAQAIEDSRLRMLRLAASAEQTGAATLAELQSQGEQLKRAQRDQVKIVRDHNTP